MSGKNIRHELRTPLNHIIGYGEMLIEDMEAEGGSEFLDAFQSICAEGRHLLSCINAPAVIDEEHLQDAFGDWRTPLEKIQSLLQGVKGRIGEGGPDRMSDIDRIESAAAHLWWMLEGIRGGGRMPVAPTAGAEPAQPASPGKAEATDGGAVRGRLLVVDDNAANLDLMRRRLEREGFAVETASDGYAALERIAAGEFDVALLDVLMPGMSGIEVLKTVRETYSSHRLPVIMVTSKHASENIVEALNMGANDYITKPVDFPVALARISTQLYLRRVTRELAEANERLHRYSYLDGLTGIPNRRNFDEYLRQEWGRAVREGGPLSLIMLDVDCFKLFNDNYGHDAGDQVLKQVARTLQGAIYRSADLVARYGGEEFVVVLPQTSAPAAVALAERLRSAVAGLGIPHEFSKGAAHVTVSLGVGSLPSCADASHEQLLGSADHALYDAKGRGRNRVGCSGSEQPRCAETCVAYPHACQARD